jgi:8-oxo-dGTP diphosphatase
VPDPGRPSVPCAGGIVLDTGDDGRQRLLVIRRGRPPGEGRWSVPGGRCLPGETTAACCVREVREETGLDVAVLRLAGRVERDAPGGAVFVIDDYLCRANGGTLVAGDDAAAARWVTRAELVELPLVPQLWEALAGWSALPA